MRALGVLCAACYRLSRLRLLHLPLDVAGALAAAAAMIYTLAVALLQGRWPVSPLLLPPLGLWLLATAVARRRGYLVFAPAADSAPGAGFAPGAALEPLQPVALRASGLFEVREERRVYVEAAGKLEATALGERILMVQVRPASVLGLLTSDEDEWGWWYAFFRPEEVAAVTPGELRFGWRPRPALRVEFATPGRRPAHLSFDDPATRDLVAADLQGHLAEART